MALALSVPEPAALVLFEPLGSLPGLAVEYITRRLSALAAGGACVLSMTASPADAARLSESIWLLEGGRIVRPVPCPSGVSLTPGTAPELVVRTDQPRALLAALASAPAVRAVSWNEATEVGQLRVRGEDVSQVSLAVLQAACQTGAALSTMAAVLPPLDQVRAASAGLVRGAYEHALQMARAGHTAAEAPPAPAAAATSTNDGSSQ
jgi:ABC-2 type transport system ATP-binding protein